MDQLTKKHDQLKKEVEKGSKADHAKTRLLLSELKIGLTKLGALIPLSDVDQQAKYLLLSRDVLELGAFSSLHQNNIPSFENYLLKLKAFYIDYRKQLPESPKMHVLLGLNLMRLLAANNLADFHSDLEHIAPIVGLDNVYIRQPIQVETCLMEGSFNKLWYSSANVPAPEYSIFMDLLMKMIREEISSCMEATYESLSVADASAMLYFKGVSEFKDFAKQKKWNTTYQQRIQFREPVDAKQSSFGFSRTIARTLRYAREMERII
ncbi:COP9 signalosome [Cladochytrium replicatum]|nr:COP9 signalosome [Cladochytrium replicatum]